MPTTATTRPAKDSSLVTRESEAGALRAPNVHLLGGAVSTGNLGVAALGAASVKGILRAAPGARVTLQNWGGADSVEISLGDRSVRLRTTQLHPGDSLRARAGTRHLQMLADVYAYTPRAMKGWICRANRTFEMLVETDAALALCGGDSFSDLYEARSPFRFMVEATELLKRLDKPLILMPQTYGPFRTAESRRAAREIMEYSSLTATRDAGGVDELREALGGWAPNGVAECPDTAFDLDPTPVEAWREPELFGAEDERERVGLNVSGLLYFGKQNFGLRSSYPEMIRATAEWILSRPERRLVLVPHVVSHVTADQEGEVRTHAYDDVSDTAACRTVRRELSALFGERVICLGGPYTEGETKTLIGRCDFMIGARMHACIAAVSQGIPTVTQAYSKKARGVMGHVGRAAYVQDLRAYDAGEIVEQIARMYERREEIRAVLQAEAPRVRVELRRFFEDRLRPALTEAVRRNSR